jgi:hypothetical protein
MAAGVSVVVRFLFIGVPILVLVTGADSSPTHFPLGFEVVSIEY